MAARDLLGRSIEPYTHEDPPGTVKAEIPLKVPRFGDIQGVLRDYQAHSLYMLGRIQQLVGNNGQPAPAQPQAPPVDTVYAIAVPLLEACMVEDLNDDETFELMGALGVQLETDLNHPLLTRCLELAGQRPPDAVDMSDEDKQELMDKLLGGESRPDPLPSTSG